MRKIFGALLALTSILGGLAAGVPTVSAAGNYTVSISDDTANEGSPAEFTVFLQQFLQPPDTVSVRATTSDGTAIGTGFGNPCAATTDYVSRSAVVVLTNAQPTRTFVVQTCDDAIAESNEAFSATLSDPMADCGGETPCSATINDGTGVGTIVDNEPTPSPSPSPSPSPTPSGSPSPSPSGSPSATPTELPPGPTTLTVVDVPRRAGPGQNCLFHVNRLGDASGTTTVNFVTSGKPRLVANVAGTLVFGPRETVKTILVDVLRRPRREKFVTLTLTGAFNALITDGTGLCELKTRRGRGRGRR